MGKPAPPQPNTLSDPREWVALHGDVLFGFAVIRVRDRAVAEDLVQDTFLAALRARDSFAGQAGERTWMVGILCHKIADNWRSSSAPSGGTAFVATSLLRLRLYVESPPQTPGYA